MRKKVDISKYTSYFHDGCIFGIQNSVGKLSISMESVEMWADNLELSRTNRLKGILHLEGVRNVLIDDQPFRGDKLCMQADSASILDLDISQNRVRLFIEWINYPPNQSIEKYSDIVIVAENVHWENIPELYDPCNQEALLIRQAIHSYDKKERSLDKLMTLNESIYGPICHFEDVNLQEKLRTEWWVIEMVESIMIDHEKDTVSEEDSKSISLALQNMRSILEGSH